MAAAMTVLDNVIACGITSINTPGLGTSPAGRISEGLFEDDFETCMTLQDKDVDNMCKTFSDLTQAQVRLLPQQIRRLKAFAQHVCHILRLQLNLVLALHAFNPANVVALIN